jgi:MPBQ/MSBQ methyltransferase
MSVAAVDMSRPQERPAPAFAARYDALIFDPLIRAYYGSGFYNVGYWEPGTESQEQASAQLVERLLQHAPPDAAAILDVACGLGATTALAARRFPQGRVAGINISEAQLGECRQQTGGVFAAMDAACLGVREGSFDLALCVEAAFHFRTRQQFLRHVYRALRPGGCLALSDILFSDSPWAGAWTVPEENFLCDLDAYRALLVAEGFVPIALEDATEPCWGGFCRHLAAWIEAGLQTGSLDREIGATWRGIVAGLSSGAVRHYLLAAALRP